jgi:hypothetical protein
MGDERVLEERNPLHSYLRSLRSAASETSKALAKIDVRQNNQWPALLSHFAVVSSQLRALAEGEGQVVVRRRRRRRVC